MNVIKGIGGLVNLHKLVRGVAEGNGMQIAKGVGGVVNTALSTDPVTGAVIKRSIDLASGEEQATAVDRMVGKKLIDYYGDRDGVTELEDVGEIAENIVEAVGEGIGNAIEIIGDLFS